MELCTTIQVINSDGWDHVVTTSGERPITVWSRKLAPGTHLQSEAADDVAAAKFSCIKATAVIQAPPQTVYKLFLDNSRVQTHKLGKFSSDFSERRVGVFA